EIHEIMQENNSKEVQPPSATIMQPMVEEIQPRMDIVQQHDDKLMQQKVEGELQQNKKKARKIRSLLSNLYHLL
ncbi:hypothetical protein PIB30_088781, partial [Stylosanthes scabra]|nr:hypothetical protein [Stylosanthes scabra]